MNERAKSLKVEIFDFFFNFFWQKPFSLISELSFTTRQSWYRYIFIVRHLGLPGIVKNLSFLQISIYQYELNNTQ